MYGALRNRASNSSQLAGLSIAALITALAAYALGQGFGASIIRLIETPITFTPLLDEVIPDPTQRETTLVMGGDTLETPPLDFPPDIFVPAEDKVYTPPRTEVAGPSTGASVTPAPKLIRVRPVLLPQTPPDYPASAIRQQQQGVSTLDVCVDARGRVSSATLAAGSGHATLDNAALKWVRSARFTPGKLDGVAQSVCGHTVVYEWNLEDARR